jgi:prophage DNA circulation protein
MDDRMQLILQKAGGLAERARLRAAQYQAVQEQDAQKEAAKNQRHMAEMTALATDLARIQASLGLLFQAVQSLAAAQSELLQFVAAPRENVLQDLQMQDGKVVGATVKTVLKSVK